MERCTRYIDGKIGANPKGHRVLFGTQPAPPLPYLRVERAWVRARECVWYLRESVWCACVCVGMCVCVCVWPWVWPWVWVWVWVLLGVGVGVKCEVSVRAV